MKKYLLIILSIISIYALFDFAYFYKGDLYIPSTGNIEYISKTINEDLYIKNSNDTFEIFDMKGVNMGLGKPGHFATEKSITKDEYLKWFKEIKEMGANVLRIYTIGPTDFYEAFYEFNLDNPDPLYLLHGVWVDDYLLNSRFSALDEEFYKPFHEDIKDVIDVVHGRFKTRNIDEGLLPIYYKHDISQWVYGYILGVEWEYTLVTYTNESFAQLPQYDGKYLYTDDASNFEIFLAESGDIAIDYETKKYGEQKVIAFSNWATTDPFDYDPKIAYASEKCAKVDVEHIKTKPSFKTGQFASYHIYPYYPEFYEYLTVHDKNSYLQYLTDINRHHKMPVVISEFGIPSSRGKAAEEEGLGRNQGFMSEQDQGYALTSLYDDIKKAGSSGAIVFTWQDEWFKRTWNTMANIDLDVTAYWSDYQTNEQYFGLLAFDPGRYESICYVDGYDYEWDDKDIISKGDDYNLSMKYDEKFIYFLIDKNGNNIINDHLFIPIDTTPKSGSTFAENFNLEMSENTDFIIEINGKEHSRLWVQERYDTVRTLYLKDLTGSDDMVGDNQVARDSSKFNTILLPLVETDYYQKNHHGPDFKISFQQFGENLDIQYGLMRTYETGKLLYGNANPKSYNFNSLADFCANDSFIEIKIPWQLLNFVNPVNMQIHDDYYENLGIEYMRINSMNVGVGNGTSKINMVPFDLKRLGYKPEYHERLKESYYILKEHWTKH